MSKFKSLFIILNFILLALPRIIFSQDVADYDENIAKLVHKLTQYPNNSKRMTELNENFNLANQADLNYIHELKATGQPDIWYRIYQAHLRIKERQDLVMTLPPKTIRQIKFEYIDNSKGLEESKNRATMYSYALAEKLLGENNPEAAQKAYFELLKVAVLQNGNYRDLDKLIRRSILSCAATIEFELVNMTNKKLPNDIVARLNQIVWEYKKAALQKNASQEPVGSLQFVLKVVINAVEISSDQIKQLTYGEERDVYRDNVVVDTIRCDITEFRQRKVATCIGRIDYYDVQLKKVVNVVPIRVESVFANAYGTLQGNPDAAGEDSRKLLNSKAANYPSDAQMLLDAIDDFVKQATSIILEK